MAVPAGLLKDGNEDEFGVVLAAQWPARARPTGPAALALLTGAARDAGLTAYAKRTRSLRSGGGWVDATREWLVGAKGEYPLHRHYLPSASPATTRSGSLPWAIR
jgi:hypothetical protein